MDRAEGAFLVAERALTEARAAAAVLAGMPTPGRVPTAFVVNTDGDLVVMFDDGTTTAAGRVRGIDGRDGAAGASVNDAAIDSDGSLILRTSDGRTMNAGRVRGDAGLPGKDAPVIPGPAGRSVTAAKIDDRGHLVLTFSDGTAEDAGLSAIKGDQGEPGTDGARGPDGPMGNGIDRAEIDASGSLGLTFTDGRKQSVGRVVGADGKAGTVGAGVSGAKIANGNLQLTLTDGTEINAGRVVGKDGKPGAAVAGPKGEPGEPAIAPEIGESVSARLTAADMPRLRERELIIGDVSLRVLVLE